MKPEHYYLTGTKPQDEEIKKFVKERKGIVHGARATNAQLPTYLDKHTDDWDMFVSSDALAAANKLESMLDARYGGNYFEVKPALHPRTYRVMSRVTNKEVVDITVPDRSIEYETIDGIRFATLDYHVKQIKRTLEDPGARFRHARDKETLQRIRIHQKARGTDVFRAPLGTLKET